MVFWIVLYMVLSGLLENGKTETSKIESGRSLARWLNFDDHTRKIRTKLIRGWESDPEDVGGFTAAVEASATWLDDLMRRLD